MRTKALSLMVQDVKAEAGHALGVAQGNNNYETLKYLLARTQEELWTAFVWPDLRTRTHITLTAGQYIYPYPATTSFDMIRETYHSLSPGSGNPSWDGVSYGIGEDYINADGSNTNRADPVQAWDVETAESFRVYPTPDTSGGSLRFVGQKPLAPFIADSDTSTLDATTIVLFTAADLLARAKAEDAPTKMQKAQRHLLKLLGNKISSKMKVSSLGGGAPRLPYTTNRHLIYGPGN
jgi:hypothetical protein